MAFSYTGDPRTSARDAVRFLAQDTSATKFSIADEEIDYLLAQFGSNVYATAAAAADIIASNFTTASAAGGVQSKSVGSLSISYSDRASEYREVAKTLRRQMAIGVGSAIAVYSGGISKADKDLQEADTDWDKPWFVRGIHDNPQAGEAPVPWLGYST